VIDRTGEMLGNGGTDEERTERNTAQMLRRLAHGLGFERVTVRFQKPPAV
jgi:hypothetical protein